MPEVFTAKKSSQKPSHKSSQETTQQKVCHRHVDEYSEILRAERPSSNPLRSFLPKPLAVYFEAQIEDEHILLVLRQHPIILFKSVLIILGLSLAPLLFSFVNFFGIFPAAYQLAGLMLWYLMITGFSLEVFLTWFFSVYIITDERIIDVDFLSLIYKDVSTAKIDKIEDVTVLTGGTVQSLFNFGTVKIQTAATKAEIQFEQVPQPSKVARLLDELILEEEREKLEGRVR